LPRLNALAGTRMTGVSGPNHHAATSYIQNYSIQPAAGARRAIGQRQRFTPPATADPSSQADTNMKLAVRRARRRGFLTFEWILLITVLAIGIVGGLAALRDSIINELKDLCGAVEALNMTPNHDKDQPHRSPPQVVPPGAGS